MKDLEERFGEEVVDEGEGEGEDEGEEDDGDGEGEGEEEEEAAAGRAASSHGEPSSHGGTQHADSALGGAFSFAGVSNADSGGGGGDTDDTDAPSAAAEEDSDDLEDEFSPCIVRGAEQGRVDLECRFEEKQRRKTLRLLAPTGIPPAGFGTQRGALNWRRSAGGTRPLAHTSPVCPITRMSKVYALRMSRPRPSKLVARLRLRVFDIRAGTRTAGTSGTCLQLGTVPEVAVSSAALG